MSAPIFDACGTPTELRDDATYTVDARLPDGQQLSDAGVHAWQVRQAIERADALGITLTRIIEESPLDYDAMMRAFSGRR
jgi:hypothetical protein